MQRLNVQDAAFLQVETEECPAHVAGLQIFELPKGYRGNFFRNLMEQFDNGEQVQPPFNHKLHTDFLRLDVWPHWVEDKDFDLDYHVRFVALPAPGSMDQLMKLVERLHSRLLDRTRPLWECYMIEGLEGRKVAIYFKVHHSCIDGVAAMSVMENSLARSPRVKNVQSVWQIGPPNRKKPTQSAKLLNTISKTYTGLMGQARSVQQLSTALVKTGLRTLGGATRKSPLPFTAPDTLFNVDITSHRRFAVHSMPLERLKALSKDLEVTINDVSLAICAGALRRYLARREALPEKPLISMVPVSIRPPDAESSGNLLTMIVTTLATDIDDPVERVRVINASSADAKKSIGELSREAAVNYSLLMNGAVLLSQALKLSSRVAPPANLVISNVPGPQKPLYLAGARLVHNYPVSVLVHGLALNITLTSYDGKVDFGLLGGREALPDIDKMAEFIGDACDELEEAVEAMLTAEVADVRRKLAARGKSRVPTSSRKAIKSKTGSSHGRKAGKKSTAKATGT